MKRLGTFIAALLLTSALTPAYAQSSVSVIGAVVPGNCADFSSATIIRDAGVVCGGGGGSVGLGTPTNVLNTVVTNYTIATGDCGKTIQAGAGTSGFFTITVPSVSGFSPICVVTITNGDSNHAKRIANDPGCDNVYHYLWMNQSCALAIVNGIWQAQAVPGRFSVPSATTLFVDAVNGHDDGSTDCLSTTTGACATVTHAAAIVCDQFAINGNQVSITPPLGVPITENVSLCNYVPGSVIATATNPQILGNPANPATYSIAPTSGNGITAVHVNTPWVVNGISVGGSGINSCIESDINSTVYVRNVIFNTCSIMMQALFGGSIEVIGGISIVGSTVAVAATQYGARWLIQNDTVTCVGSPAVSVWAQALSNSSQEWGQATFSGCSGVTGQRYQTATGGGIDTNGGGANFLPGNAGGTAANPGWYN